MPRAQRWLAAWNALVFAAWLAAPFAAAGRAAWAPGWGYLAVLAVALVGHRVFVARRNPALARRRARIGAGTPAWDLWWNALVWPLMAAGPVAAGLEARSGAPPLPAWCWPLGAAGLYAGLALSAAAMAANPFFEATARLQPEAGQRVIEAGPYRRLRHPGYAGLALWALATPLLLRSPRAFGPALAAAAWVALRAALEDRLLRRGLPGYAAYAGRVRWRLVPRVW